jgi:hypothetical protein
MEAILDWYKRLVDDGFVVMRNVQADLRVKDEG